jgi:putative transposase
MVMKVRRDLPRVGTRKLYHMLREPLSELGVGRDKLFTILNANNMSIKAMRSYRTTTNSKHIFHKHKNLVTGIVPTRPEQIWVSDITYIGNRGSHHYLALVTDAYSKKIVGYDLSESLNVEGCVRALEMAINNKMYVNKPLIHHSDRGIQYCCDEYQKQMAKHGIKCSMTESYDPYANAVAERVNGVLKQEFKLEEYNANTVVLKIIVKQSIERYNEVRPHLSCGMLTPNQMHKQQEVKIKTYKKIWMQPDRVASIF